MHGLAVSVIKLNHRLVVSSAPDDDWRTITSGTLANLQPYDLNNQLPPYQTFKLGRKP